MKTSRTHLSPRLQSRDPSLPSTLRVTTKTKQLDKIIVEKKKDVSFRKKCCNFLYNKNDKTFCGRSCLSWLYLFIYSIMYVLFLCTFTMLCLYAALSIVKMTVNFTDNIDALTYPEFNIGLTATPTSESHEPVIWYQVDRKDDYNKYIKSINDLLAIKRRKTGATELGPCGVSPYGYGENPCIILRVNKHMLWSGKPLRANSSKIEKAPTQVREWAKKDKKLWLHCDGYHSYDKEHAGRIRYYPDPPGFNPDLFPPGSSAEPQLIAIQLSEFALDVSLAFQCTLWYERGPSTIEFVVYVSSTRTVSNRTLV